MSRVLLFCPTVKLTRLTSDAIHGLQFDGALDVMFARDNPYDGSANIIYNYRKAERIIKNEGYDYLFTVEDDMIPPPDALQKMSAIEADIVYGVYCFRKGKPSLNISKPDDLQESYSLPHNMKDWKRLFGQVIPCGGLGFGCTLIKRSVFDVLEFHSTHGHDGDTQMAHDARRLGLRQMCDTTVLVGHRRPDTTVVWPTGDGYKEAGTHVPLPRRAIIPNRKLSFWTQEEVAMVVPAGVKCEVDIETAASFVGAGMAAYA